MVDFHAVLERQRTEGALTAGLRERAVLPPNLSPSPWRVGKINPHVVYAADGTTVVVCRNADDARLIATAPRMVAVLQSCYEELDCTDVSAHQRGECLDRQIRAVIQDFFPSAPTAETGPAQ
jgi:hypothetical protein